MSTIWKENKMALIEIINVDKIYNTTAVPVHAVKNVSLKIE